MVSLVPYPKNFRLRRSVFIKFGKNSSFLAKNFGCSAEKEGQRKKIERRKKKEKRKKEKEKRKREREYYNFAAQK